MSGASSTPAEVSPRASERQKRRQRPPAPSVGLDRGVEELGSPPRCIAWTFTETSADADGPSRTRALFRQRSGTKSAASLHARTPPEWSWGESGWWHGCGASCLVAAGERELREPGGSNRGSDPLHDAVTSSAQEPPRYRSHSASENGRETWVAAQSA